MSIDGIGKKPDLPVQPHTTDGARAKTFSIEGASPIERSSEASSVSGSAAVSNEQYLDSKIQEAMAPYATLPAKDRAMIEATLREKLMNDPTFSELALKAHESHKSGD